jgi:hypothetical protein
MRLFLSYSRSDGAFVGRLSADLQQAGHDVWVDTDDIPGGSAWRRSIGEGIARADVVIVVVTPQSMASPNVEREVTVADEAGRRLLPVQAADAVIPPALSFVLAGVQRVDFTSRPYAEAFASLLAALQTVANTPGGTTARTSVEEGSSMGAAAAAPTRLARSKPRTERGPSRLQLGIALAVVVAIAAFLSGVLIATRRSDPLAIGQFQRAPDCSGVVVVTGSVPKADGAKKIVSERLRDTDAALRDIGLQDGATYIDGDTSCFAAAATWLTVVGPFATGQQAAQVCSALRRAGEFGQDPSIGLSLRTSNQSANCG